MLLPNTVNDTTIRKAIRKAAEEAGGSLADDDIRIRRCPCDSLVNLELPPGWIIEGHDPGGVAVRSPGGGQSGGVDLPGSGSLTVGLNFLINTYDPSQQTDNREVAGRGYAGKGIIPPDNPATSKQIKVAVFDSGFLPGANYLSDSYLLSTTSCTNDALDPAKTNALGWNFTIEGDEKTTTDLTPVHHGSRVANLLVRQFSNSNIVPKIVPMKVLNGHNQGDLYGLMCAMKTAQKNGVKVFNMSLGYYGGLDSLFRKYIAEAHRAGIWIIVAAGNHLVDSTSLNRDLTTLNPQFYPAMFAAEFDRVVPVTTVSRDVNGLVVACIRQNYAKEYVVGAMDNSVPCYFRMHDGPGSSVLDIYGTSYASPVVAGWIARKLVESPGVLNSRADISGQISNTNQGTGNQVMANKYIKSLP
ncbi:S8 family serine peptidase [Spirosoma fluviale]|uniref:S8 family serine peptidase n=1 Tax=Spirosoma fluviale TaxID=1597977 RepID=UPI0015CE0720|nr:S8 family serine peptidase [Spirosoma fluviale]